MNGGTVGHGSSEGHLAPTAEPSHAFLPAHHSLARTSMVLVIPRTVRPFQPRSVKTDCGRADVSEQGRLLHAESRRLLVHQVPS